MTVAAAGADKAAVTGLHAVHLSCGGAAEGRWATLPQDMMAMTGVCWRGVWVLRGREGGGGAGNGEWVGEGGGWRRGGGWWRGEGCGWLSSNRSSSSRLQQAHRLVCPEGCCLQAKAA